MLTPLSAASEGAARLWDSVAGAWQQWNGGTCTVVAATPEGGAYVLDDCGDVQSSGDEQRARPVACTELASGVSGACSGPRLCSRPAARPARAPRLSCLLLPRAAAGAWAPQYAASKAIELAFGLGEGARKIAAAAQPAWQGSSTAAGCACCAAGAPPTSACAPHPPSFLSPRPADGTLYTLAGSASPSSTLRYLRRGVWGSNGGIASEQTRACMLRCAALVCAALSCAALRCAAKRPPSHERRPGPCFPCRRRAGGRRL